jgi:hypothetical protein
MSKTASTSPPKPRPCFVVLETAHGTLYDHKSGGGSPYLSFIITNAPPCFWDAIQELNQTLHKARLGGHQILINQGSFHRMHGTHVQVRLQDASDFEKLLFLRPKERTVSSWADAVDDDD